MAKRSRKLSTRRPRRSKSSSRKTMKRTKRQPSKKRTLKKRKSRTKSVRKRKKTKKVMKGGAGIKVNDFIVYFNKSGNNSRDITTIIMGEIPRPIKIKMAVEITKLTKSTNHIISGNQPARVRPKSGGLDQYLIFLTNNKERIIGVLISSYNDKIIVKAHRNNKLEPEIIYKFIKDNYINRGRKVTDDVSHQQQASRAESLGQGAITAVAKSAAAVSTIGAEEALYRPIYDLLQIDYKVSEYFYSQKPGEADYFILTLLDDENNGSGTTVKIVMDSATGNKSIPKFTDYMPTTTPISSFETLEEMFNYYKRQKFIYSKGTVRSEAVLLGNEIQ